MGVQANISHNKFPQQGCLLNQRVRVCFNYDTENSMEATCIRDDTEEPFKTIFRLDNGRVVLSAECQYTY